MTRHKVHFWIWDIKPNESDTEGSGYTSCGREYAEKLTDDKAKVTCEDCLDEAVPAHEIPGASSIAT